MARTLSLSTKSNEILAIDLSRALSRLEQKILSSPPNPRLQHSSHERTKTSTVSFGLTRTFSLLGCLRHSRISNMLGHCSSASSTNRTRSKSSLGNKRRRPRSSVNAPCSNVSLTASTSWTSKTSRTRMPLPRRKTSSVSILLRANRPRLLPLRNPPLCPVENLRPNRRSATVCTHRPPPPNNRPLPPQHPPQ